MFEIDDLMLKSLMEEVDNFKFCMSIYKEIFIKPVISNNLMKYVSEVDSAFELNLKNITHKEEKEKIDRMNQ